jgi:hypothetical protein
MTGTGTRRSGRDLLGIYLNDHLAGATGGTELARRVAASDRDPAAGALQHLAADIAQDRAALLGIVAALGIQVRTYKVCAAWIGEKAARLKVNGYLLARSPLSSLAELEMLRLAVEGKAAGWRTLRTLAASDKRLDPDRLDELISRARRQGGRSRGTPRARRQRDDRDGITGGMIFAETGCSVPLGPFREAEDHLDLPEAGASSRSQAVSRSRDLGLLDQRGADLSPFHPVGAMPLRATRWIVMA